MKRKLLVVAVSVIALAFVVSLASQAVAKEDWFTGKITKEGQFVTDQGQNYTLTGKEAPEALKNVDKRIEIKGTVMEKEGKKTLEVEKYKMAPAETKKEAPEQSSKW